jgi:hypothetical protein
MIFIFNGLTMVYSNKNSAERVGFEPTEPFGSHALQACALGQTTQPLQWMYLAAVSPQAARLYYIVIIYGRTPSFGKKQNTFLLYPIVLVINILAS